MLESTPFPVVALMFIVTCFFIAVIAFDWSRVWNHARRRGVIVSKDKQDRLVTIALADHTPEYRWEREFLAYKAWTWIVRIAALLIAGWHLVLGFAWCGDLAIYLLERWQ